jgi:hypothetical protein
MMIFDMFSFFMNNNKKNESMYNKLKSNMYISLYMLILCIVMLEAMPDILIIGCIFCAIRCLNINNISNDRNNIIIRPERYNLRNLSIRSNRVSHQINCIPNRN